MKKILIFGVFDGLHEGHRHFIAEARKLGDHLTVVVAKDEVVEQLKGHEPKFPILKRIEHLKAVDGINEIVAGDATLGTWTAAKSRHPDVIAVGYDQTALRADLGLHLSEFNPIPEIIEIGAHKPTEYHSSIMNNKHPLKSVEKTLYLLAAVLAPIVLTLNFSDLFPPRQENLFLFYVNSILGESRQLGAEIIAIAYITLGVFLIVNLFKILAGSKKLDGKTAGEHLWEDLKHFGREIGAGMRIVIPILLNLFLISYLIGNIDAVNQNRLVDAVLAGADHWLTGAYPFLSLETVRFPAWFTKAVEFSFLNLASLLVLAAILIFFKDKKIFSKYVLAFFASIFIMIPLWLLVPVMSPQDRFIDNVRHFEDPPQISSALANFSPPPEVKNFLAEIRGMKSNLSILPTTTFPSAHAAWAVIAFIYLAEAAPVAAIVLAPFLVLSTFGIFYLAQHYFVDAPAGIIVGIVAVLLVNSVFKKYYGEKRYK